MYHILYGQNNILFEEYKILCIKSILFSIKTKEQLINKKNKKQKKKKIIISFKSLVIKESS